MLLYTTAVHTYSTPLLLQLYSWYQAVQHKHVGRLDKCSLFRVYRVERRVYLPNIRIYTYIGSSLQAMYKYKGLPRAEITESNTVVWLSWFRAALCQSTCTYTRLHLHQYNYSIRKWDRSERGLSVGLCRQKIIQVNFSSYISSAAYV